MAEYIDREALIQELDAKLCALHGELDENRIVYDAFTDGFEECVGEVGKFQFAADVAPVVRCKDCKSYKDNTVGGFYCANDEVGAEIDYQCFIPPNEEFYCPYGERRASDGK